jgi:large subunit ribosomal protein L24
MFLKKNDTVVVLAGKDKGKKGKVLRVLAQKGTVIVEKVNMIKRHTRPNPQKQIKGGVVEREAPVRVDKVMVVCPECRVPTRVGHAVQADGTRTRVCKKCSGFLG